MGELIHHFLSLYAKGDLEKAIELVIKEPEASYSELDIQDAADRQLVNFIDEAVFGRIRDFPQQAQNFFNVLMTDKLKSDPAAVMAMRFMPYETQLLLFAFDVQGNLKKIESLIPPFQVLLMQLIDKMQLTIQDMHFALADIPHISRNWANFQFFCTYGWRMMQKSKAAFCMELVSSYMEMHPWYPLKYSIPVPVIEYNQEQLPVIFFEPTKMSQSTLCEQLKDKPAIYIFSTFAHFFHSLTDPEFAESLSQEMHIVYVLEHYPNLQFLLQKQEVLKNKQLKPFFFTSAKVEKGFEKSFLEALHDLINQPIESLSQDSAFGNRLYEITKRLIFAKNFARLGEHYLLPLYVRTVQRDWYDVHKGLPVDSELGPGYDSYLEPFLAKLAVNRKKRPFKKKKKILIAHVVPQILDGGHAPSRILENLVMKSDRELFDVLVICTEAIQNHPSEYPFNNYTSLASNVVGIKRISRFQMSDAKILRNGSANPYFQEGKDLANLLNEYDVDVAVFHGPSVANLIAAQLTDVPLRVYFEHGSQSYYPGFDLAILSSLDAESYKNHYAKLQTKTVSLPYALDVKEHWHENADSRESLNIPEDALIMTTISTKLDVRLTDEMLHAIAEILSRVPKAWYAPMGHVEDMQRILRIFAPYCVEDRFRSLGVVADPSQKARSMHLYLNEFPFGSCIGMLDAMAAGCPVVSMYDANGPQQARYAGQYMDMDHVITTGKKEDYIELACSLLNDPEKYREWSKHTQDQYQKYSDVGQYMANFEKIIQQNLEANS